MSELKVGDEVEINLFDAAGWLPGGKITEIRDDTQETYYYIELYGNIGFSPRNIRKAKKVTATEKTLIERIIAGEKVESEQGLKNGYFGGYLIHFPCDNGECKWTQSYVVNSEGKIIQLIEVDQIISANFGIKLQSDKTKYHTVAYKEKCLWRTDTFSDDTLSKIKHNFEQYKILETFYE